MKLKILFFVIFSCYQGLNATNLINNGSFEDGEWPTNKTGTWAISSDAKFGTNSIKATSGSALCECASNVISIRKAGVYRISAWIKTDDLSNKDAVEIRILQIDENNQAITWLGGTAAPNQIVTGRHKGWQKYERTVQNFHPSCKSIKIYLRLLPNQNGEAYFDNIEFAPVSLIQDFSFDNSIWNGDKAGFGWVRRTLGAHSGNTCIYSEDVTKYLSTAVIDIDSNQKYSLSAYIQTEDVIEPNGVQIQILQCNSDNQAIGWYKLPGSSDSFIFSQSGTQAYTKHQLDDITFHPDTAKVKIYVRHIHGSGGKAWIDDVQLIAKHRDNYIWGVSGHAPYVSSAYKKTNLQECMDLASYLGVDTYRVDFQWLTSPSGVVDWSWPDLVVSKAYQNNKKIYAVLTCNINDTYQEIYDKIFTAVTRYKGKIDYYQLSNERDNKTILSSQYSGESPSHYDMTKYNIWKNALNAMSNAVHDADPDAKRVINISWKHTAFLEMLDNDGVQWEINALDWYWGATNHLDDTMNALIQLNKEIIIAESNRKNGTYNATEIEAAEVILEHANYFYNHNTSLLKGFIIYELLDQLNHPVTEEKYYGLYNSDGSGNIGNIKVGGTVFKNFILSHQ